jgi:hypothetical protein
MTIAFSSLFILIVVITKVLVLENLISVGLATPRVKYR